jgi:HAD superfamily hydrolase (TIGR01509 family)
LIFGVAAIRWPRAVVFDMDGLMFDSERLEFAAWRAAAAQYGYAYTDELHRSFVGRRDADCERDLIAHFGPQFPTVTIRELAHSHWHRQVTTKGMPWKAGLIELLDYLDAERVPKAIATSTIRGRALLALGQLANRFGVLVCGDEVANGKPAPEIYLRAAEYLAIPPVDCLALEDSLAGVEAAKRAGMMVAQVPDLVDAGAGDHPVFQTLNEVTAMLRATRFGAT